MRDDHTILRRELRVKACARALWRGDARLMCTLLTSWPHDQAYFRCEGEAVRCVAPERASRSTSRRPRGAGWSIAQASRGAREGTRGKREAEKRIYVGAKPDGASAPWWRKEATTTEAERMTQGARTKRSRRWRRIGRQSFMPQMAHSTVSRHGSAGGRASGACAGYRCPTSARWNAYCSARRARLRDHTESCTFLAKRRELGRAAFSCDVVCGIACVRHSREMPPHAR